MYACPDCGAELAAVEGSPNLLKCPACGHECFALAYESSEESGETDAIGTDDELSALRIQNLSRQRRATNRAASYYVVAAGVCVVGIAQLSWMTWQHVRALGWTPRPIGYLIFMLLALWGGVSFIRRARELRREAKQSALADPIAEPDFSTLDDGSKHWKNLEDVQ
jgi:hypothetical protein